MICCIAIEIYRYKFTHYEHIVVTRCYILKNNKKKFLIVSTVEPFTGLDPDTVPWRTGRIYQILTQKGYNGKIITSSFSHYTRRYRKANCGSDYIILKSLSYQRNISIFRLVSYAIQVPQIIYHILRSRPKFVLITLPPVVHLFVIPIVKIIDKDIKFWLDIRDLWPEIFVEYFSKLFGNKVAALLLIHLFYYDVFIKKSDIVSTISPRFLSLLTLKKSSKSKLVDWFPHPKTAMLYSKNFTIRKHKKIKFVYLGSLSERTGILNFAKKVIDNLGSDNCEIIIGGRGQLERDIIDFAKIEPAIKYIGWVNGNDVADIILGCDCGLIPYPKTLDFNSSFPNKYLEYCSLGMRVLSNELDIYDDAIVLKF